MSADLTARFVDGVGHCPLCSEPATGWRVVKPEHLPRGLVEWTHLALIPCGHQVDTVLEKKPVTTEMHQGITRA